MFSIELTERSYPCGRGRILLGSFEETFEVVLDYWRPEQYEAHWRLALSAIVAGRECDALITSSMDPAWANFIIWWPMYRAGDDVWFQNHLLPMRELDGPYVLDDYRRHIQTRVSVNEDGLPISEWRVGIAAIRRFLANSLAVR